MGAENGWGTIVSEENENRKDATVGANRLGLHRALCGFAADRARRPPFRALSFFGVSPVAPQGRSVLRSLFSVLCSLFSGAAKPPLWRDSVEIPRAARPTGAMEPAGFPRKTVFAVKLLRTLLGGEGGVIRRPLGRHGRWRGYNRSRRGRAWQWTQGGR